jgi:hypothetical protein
VRFTCGGAPGILFVALCVGRSCVEAAEHAALATKDVGKLFLVVLNQS